jgi:hypothetical protein
MQSICLTAASGLACFEFVREALDSISKWPSSNLLNHFTVRSHQDDKETELIALPWTAKLNIVCTHLATQQLRLSSLETCMCYNAAIALTAIMPTLPERNRSDTQSSL